MIPTDVFAQTPTTPQRDRFCLCCSITSDAFNKFFYSESSSEVKLSSSESPRETIVSLQTNSFDVNGLHPYHEGIYPPDATLASASNDNYYSDDQDLYSKSQVRERLTLTSSFTEILELCMICKSNIKTWKSHNNWFNFVCRIMNIMRILLFTMIEMAIWIGKALIASLIMRLDSWTKKSFLNVENFDDSPLTFILFNDAHRRSFHYFIRNQITSSSMSSTNLQNISYTKIDEPVVFAEMNQMLTRVGIKLERSAPPSRRGSPPRALTPCMGMGSSSRVSSPKSPGSFRKSYSSETHQCGGHVSSNFSVVSSARSIGDDILVSLEGDAHLRRLQQVTPRTRR